MKKIVYIGGMRALIEYLILNIKFLEETIFFLEYDFKVNLIKKIYLKEKNPRDISRYKNYKILKKYTFTNEEKEFWIQDHLRYSPFFMGNFKNIKLLEDGLGNYTEVNKKINKRIKYSIKSWILGGTFKVDRRRFGNSESISEIYLTGIREIPQEIENKVKIVNLKKQWDFLIKIEKEKILNIFGLDKSILESLKNRKVILITQPLSEEGTITEIEKVEIYEKILLKYDRNEVLIKAHPREETNYKKYFKEIEILDKSIPMELISFLVSDLKEVVTIFSTAVFEFKNICKITFVGTKINEKIYNRYGDIEK